MCGKNIGVIVPFPLYEDYGGAVRVISQLKLIENAIKLGYIDNDITIKVLAYDVSKGYMLYINSDNICFEPVIGSKLSSKYMMGFNVKRVILDSMYVLKTLTKTKNLDTLYYQTSIIPIYMTMLRPLYESYTLNKNTIVDMHGVASSEINGLLKILASKSERDITRIVDKIIFSNLSTKVCYEKILSKINIENDIIPDVVDTNIFRPLPEDYIMRLKQNLGLSDKIIILYVGSFTEVQGIDLLLDAFELLQNEIKNIHLILAGGKWSPKIFRKYYELRNRYKNITIINSVNYLTQLNKLVNIADITVSPKKPTCQSNQKVLVYAAAGKPVVVFKTLANAFLLRDKAIYAYSIDPQEYAKAILKAYDLLTSNKFYRYKEEIIRYINEEYSFNSKKILVNLLKTILQK